MNLEHESTDQTRLTSEEVDLCMQSDARQRILEELLNLQADLDGVVKDMRAQRLRLTSEE